MGWVGRLRIRWTGVVGNPPAYFCIYVVSVVKTGVKGGVDGRRVVVVGEAV